jgi:hypothetical protein
MSWATILNKNKKEFETKQKTNETPHEIINYVNHDLKDYDEEFENSYNLKIYDLQSDFKEIIREKVLPFMDKAYNIKYSFYDFIKNHSQNYLDVIEKVNKENDEYLKELEEDEEQYNSEYFDNE